MKSVMGYSAEFVFDNQFSEAALYNIQGQNIGGAYFSFIGRDDFGNYYMSSNVLNSQIVKYDPSLVQNQAPPTASTEAPSSSDDVQQQISEAPQDNQISDNTQNNNQTFNNVQEETPNQAQQNAPDLGIPNIDIPIQNQVSDNQEQVNNVENQNFETGNNVGDNPDVPLSNGDGETTPENNTSDMVSDAGESENNSISQEVDNDAAATNNDSNDFGIGDSNNVDDTTVDDNESDVDSDTEDNDNVDDTTVDNNESNVDSDIENSNDVNNAPADNNESDGNSDTGNDDDNVSNVEEANMDLVDEDITNPVIFNATNTIRKLIDENRSQREVIDHQADELENIKSSNEILLADNNSKEQELRSLRKSMINFRGQNYSLNR